MPGSVPDMSSVVVGYVPKPEGEAALARAIEEARLREADLIVVSSHRARTGEGEPDLGEARATLDSSGIAYEVRQLTRGFEAAEDLVSVAEANDAVLIVQFPRGGQRKHATQRITETEGDFTYYLCDTDYGSSGSPVFCGEEVVALTPLGHHLARLPLDARLGKMLVLACVFGCVEVGGWAGGRTAGWLHPLWRGEGGLVGQSVG